MGFRNKISPRRIYTSFLTVKALFLMNVAELDNILVKMDNLKKDKNEIEFSEYNSEFHNYIFESNQDQAYKKLKSIEYHYSGTPYVLFCKL